jgi:hypothetical protein
MRFSNNFGIIYVLKPGDHQAGADGDSFNLGLGHTACFLIQFATLTGDGVLTIKSGATAGEKTTSETFNYRLASADQGSATADTFGDWTAASSLTLTAATYSDRVLVVEIDAAALTEGQEWVTLEFSAAASALNASVVAFVRPRYAAHAVPTMIGA